MNTFLAIDLSDKVKQSIEDHIASFKKDYMAFTWVQPENYRIHLYSFEEEENLKKIKKTVDEALFEVKPFTLFVLGMDLFLTNKIQLYLSFYREKMLNTLIKNIYREAEHTEKRDIFPHIVLGQYKVPSKQQYLLIRKKIQNLSFEIDFPVRDIVLYETITGGKKPVYKKLAKFTLQE